MSSTIYDIAREAGVSIATVSRVFNDNPKVSAATREKILEIASRYGYHPRAQAQSLARRKTGIITVIVPIISNYFFMEVLAGIQDRLAETEFDLQISNIKNSGDVREDSVRRQVEDVFKRGMSDGYIIISLHFGDKDWEYFKKFEAPITLIDEYHPEYSSVSVNNVEGGYTATKSLIEQGFEHIAMICALFDSKPVEERITGYRKAIEEAGFTFDESMLYTGLDTERDGFNELNGYQAMKALLHSKKEIDAVFCNSDIQSLGALKAMKDYQKRLPIVSFDDLSFSQYLGLSTMRQPMLKMGMIAVEKLIKQLENPDKDVTHTIFSPELIVRSSSLPEESKIFEDYVSETGPARDS